MSSLSPPSSPPSLSFLPQLLSSLTPPLLLSLLPHSSPPTLLLPLHCFLLHLRIFILQSHLPSTTLPFLSSHFPPSSPLSLHVLSHPSTSFVDFLCTKWLMLSKDIPMEIFPLNRENGMRMVEGIRGWMEKRIREEGEKREAISRDNYDSKDNTDKDIQSDKDEVIKYLNSSFATLISSISSPPPPLPSSSLSSTDTIALTPSSPTNKDNPTDPPSSSSSSVVVGSVAHYQLPWYKIFHTPLHSHPSLVPSSLSSPSSTSFSPFCPCHSSTSTPPPLHPHIYRVESGFLNNIGLVLWPAGYLLSEYLIQNYSDFLTDNGENNILELGTGIGLTMSTLIHKMRREREKDNKSDSNQNQDNAVTSNPSPDAHFICTDFQSNVLENIQYNLQLNQIPTRSSPSSTASTASSSSSSTSSPLLSPPIFSSVSPLDWLTPSSTLPTILSSLPPYRIIVAADTTYVPEILHPFALTVRHALSVANEKFRNQGGGVAILAQTERHPLYFVEYLDCLKGLGMKVEEIDVENIQQRFWYERETIMMHRVTLEMTDGGEKEIEERKGMGKEEEIK